MTKLRAFTRNTFGHNNEIAIRTIAGLLTQGQMLSELAKKNNMFAHELQDYWNEYTTPEFREKTQRLQAEALWMRGIGVIERAEKKKDSTARSEARAKRLADTYFNTAKQLDPEKWNPSVAAKIAKKKKSDTLDGDEIQYGIDQDFGNAKIADHVDILRGGVTSDFTPKYKDAFKESDTVSHRYLKSDLIAKRPNPFDTLNWNKLKVRYVATEPTA